MTDRDWLRAPCVHDWRLGPITDKLLRHRPAVCVRCWEYVSRMRSEDWTGLAIWTAADYEMRKDEVEERFF